MRIPHTAAGVPIRSTFMVLVMGALPYACSGDRVPNTEDIPCTVKLTSPAFQEGDTIPRTYKR